MRAVTRGEVLKLTDATKAFVTAHAAHTAHATHATHALHTWHATSHTAHACHIILGRGVLLILINPLEYLSQRTQFSPLYSLRNAYLVKISLQEVHLFALFQKPWPVLFLLVLLPQHKLHIPRGVVRLAVLDVDLTKEL